MIGGVKGDLPPSRFDRSRTGRGEGYWGGGERGS